MSSDARVRYTKKVITNSLITLLKTKPLNKITVKELCELSEINRATFYKHYHDVFDLVEQLEQVFLHELSENVQGDPKRTFRETFTLIMVSLQAKGELYQTLFSENGDRYFPKRLFDWCYQNSAVDIAKRFQTLTPIQRKWLYYFIAQGCSGILDQWINGGMQEPIEEVVRFADKLQRDILSDP